MKLKLSILFGAVCSSLLVSAVARAQLMGNITVEVQGLRTQEGNICFKIFNGSQGFPNNNDRASQSTTTVTGMSNSIEGL